MRKLAIPAAALLLVTLAASPAAAVDTVNSKKIRDAVTVSGIIGHERVLQRIANENGGTRASGTPGLRGLGEVREADPAQGRLQGHRAGVHVPVLPGAGPGHAGAGHADPDRRTRRRHFDFSGSGDVTGTVVPTNDVQIPPPATPGVDQRLRGRPTSRPAPAGPARSR